MIGAARSRNLYVYGLCAALVAAMGVFLIWPIVLTVSGGFREPGGAFTLRYVASVFCDPVLVEGLWNSLKIAGYTTLLCMVLTMPLAVLAARYDFFGKALLTSLVMVPLILPPFVGVIGLRSLLGRFGAINSLLMHVGVLDPTHPGIDFLGGAAIGRFWAVVVMEALHLYPIVYLNITAALANLDPALDEAAQSLGAGRWKRFWRITMPLILPGIFAGSTIVFIFSFTELGTPLMFDYYTVTPVQIFWGIQEMQANPRPYALVVVMLVVAVGLYLLGKLLIGRRNFTMEGRAAIGMVPVRLKGWRGMGAVLLFIVLITLAVMPHIGVVLLSFSVDGAWYRSVLPQQMTLEHFRNALSHPLAVGSIRNSLLYASSAMVFCVLVGLTVAYLNVRAKVKGGWLLDSLAMLPLAVPGLVMAFGYVAMSLAWPFPQLARWFDAHGLETLSDMMQVTGTSPNPVLFLVIAYAVRRLPYVVRSASAGLEQTSERMEEAAFNLGASHLTTLRVIVIPLIMANLIAGGILAFSFAMLEVSDSLVLAQKEVHYPITKAIFDLFGRLGDGPYIASAMGVWGMALLTVTLVGAGLLMGKRLGAIFRV